MSVQSSPEEAPSAGQIRVKCSSTPHEDWDKLVRQETTGTYCHLGAWGSIMTEVLGHECLFMHAWREQDGETPTLEGVLPLVRVRSLLFGHYLVSMPFLNYGGAIGGEEARRLLLDQAVEEARSSGVDLLEIRARSGGKRVAEADELCAGLTRNERKVSVCLALGPDPEGFWEEGLRSKVRTKIRRAMKEGFDVRFGKQEVDAFYEVFSRNMRDLGTPVLPRSLFHALPEAFGESVTFGVVYDGSVPVAVQCAFHKGTEIEMTWAATIKEYRRSRPNMILYWKFIELAIERGETVFNFGRSTQGSNNHRNKLEWGGEDEPLPWAIWTRGDKGETPNPGQGKYSAAIRIWQRLPLSLTRTLGPVLAKRIP